MYIIDKQKFLRSLKKDFKDYKIKIDYKNNLIYLKNNFNTIKINIYNLDILREQ